MVLTQRSFFVPCMVFLCLLVLWPLPVSLATDSEEEPRLPLAMEVFLKKPKNNWYELHVHLTNISDKPIMVDVHDLPWVPPNDSRWLSGFRLDTRKTPIRFIFPKAESGFREVRLLPGESIQDTIALNPRVPSLLEDIQKFGIQLNWDCPPSSLRFVCRQGAPNRLIISKKDNGQADVYTIDQELCLLLKREIGLISIPEGHHVLFLRTSEEVMAHNREIQALLLQADDYVRHCEPMWTNSWAASFFTEERYAGFLHEAERERYFEKGIWQKANIGHYSSQIRTLYRFPWIKKKSEAIYLSVYELQQKSMFKLVE